MYVPTYYNYIGYIDQLNILYYIAKLYYYSIIKSWPGYRD